MDEEQNKPVKESAETNSERYGNNAEIEDVYDDLSYPTPPELKEALAATDLLTDKESFAFVNGRLEGFLGYAHSSDDAEEMVQDQGFDTVSEFTSTQQTAGEKIAEAIWIYELIDAYRFPKTSSPDYCDKCGEPLSNSWVGDHRRSDSTVQCFDCADIDPEFRSSPIDSN